jgi:hypothetical protein
VIEKNLLGRGIFYRSPILNFVFWRIYLAEEIKPFLYHLPSSFNLAFLPNYGEVWLYVYSSHFARKKKEAALVF